MKLSSLNKNQVRLLVRNTGISLSYFYQLRNGTRKASVRLAKKIESATSGLVARWDLRPDIWERPKSKDAA